LLGVNVNLQEFIDYRKTCPICDGELTTGLYLATTTRKQTVKYEDDRINFIFPLESLKKSHKIAYSFSLYEPTFTIEFYTNAGERYCNRVPELLRQQFLELHKNLNKVGFNLFRKCKKCKQYIYKGGYFTIDLKATIIDALKIESESIGLVHPLDDGYFRVFQLTNFFEEKESILSFGKNKTGYAGVGGGYPLSSSTILTLPIIPFVSKEKTINRLNSLLIYI
jgi:hypothetical protein